MVRANRPEKLSRFFVIVPMVILSACEPGKSDSRFEFFDETNEVPEADKTENLGDGKQQTDVPVWINGAALSRLPDIRGVDFTTGDSSEPNLCTTTSDLDFMETPIRMFCAQLPIATNILYGDMKATTVDDSINCQDFYDSLGVEKGVLLPMLCEESILTFDGSVSSIRVDVNAKPPSEVEGEVAVSFEKAENAITDAVGSWHASGDGSERFPANIRYWDKATDEASFNPIVSLDLESLSVGHIAYEFQRQVQLSGSVHFNSGSNSESCLDDPTTESCLYQHMSLSFNNVKDLIDEGLPSVVQFRYLANQRINPELFAAEGLLQFSPEVLAVALKKETNEAVKELLSSLVYLYIRMVVEGQNIWMAAEFLDKDGSDIFWHNGTEQENLTKAILDSTDAERYSGRCRTLSGEQSLDCSWFDPEKYSFVWPGRESFSVLENPFVPFVMDMTFENIEPGINPK